WQDRRTDRHWPGRRDPLHLWQANRYHTRRACGLQAANQYLPCLQRARICRTQGPRAVSGSTPLQVGRCHGRLPPGRQTMTQDTQDQSPAQPGGQLKAIGLRKVYGKRAVVRDVSLSVASGEVVGLLGPNGAGKTTSFYMIVGIIPTDSGRIEIDDIDITSMPMHKRARLGLSYLPQDASVFRRLTVEQNIRAVLELQHRDDGKKLNKHEIQHDLDTLITELQIEQIRKNTAISLSGGERRRVEIARALATRPRFILLDEPFAGV